VQTKADTQVQKYEFAAARRSDGSGKSTLINLIMSVFAAPFVFPKVSHFVQNNPTL
jgi:ABC-type thiamine transport system ATPase subunit